MPQKKHPVICFAAGASAGHILPCLTLAAQYKHHNPETIVVFISTSKLSDIQLLAAHKSIDHHEAIPLGSRQYRGFTGCYMRIHDAIISLIKSFWLIKKYRPDCLISSGGIMLVPVSCSARLFSIPIELYELNAIPGKAIRFIAPFARQITICFKQTAHHFNAALPVVYKPYPIRFLIPKNNAVKKSKEQNDIRSHSGQKKKMLCVLGGSQGSEYLNRLVQELCTALPESQHIHLVHQTGTTRSETYRTWYETHHIQATVFPYDNALEQWYTQADLVLCRAGAGTLFELIFFGTRCITIPLETEYTDHQRDNAYALATEYPQLVTMMRQKEIEENKELFFRLVHEKLVA